MLLSHFVLVTPPPPDPALYIAMNVYLSQLEEKGFAERRQDCVDQAIREWQAMTLDQQTQVRPTVLANYYLCFVLRLLDVDPDT